MHITSNQLSRYRSRGYLFLRSCFSQAEIAMIVRELPAIFAQDLPGKVLEKDSDTIRSVYGVHFDNPVLRCLAHHPRLVHPARKLLAGDIYIHQSKVNVKAAFKGDVWHWHQDFIYWLREDGMLEPQATTAAIFLDEVNEFNGPLLFVPSSHRVGVIDTPVRETAPSWLGGAIADLKYSLTTECVATLVAQHGIVAPKGPAGSVLFFHCNIVHGSAPNMSPFNRKIIYITFNSTRNRLASLPTRRPEFMASCNFDPISPAPESALQPLNIN